MPIFFSFCYVFTFRLLLILVFRCVAMSCVTVSRTCRHVVSRRTPVFPGRVRLMTWAARAAAAPAVVAGGVVVSRRALPR